MNISERAELRVADGGIVEIHPTAKIDDDVRIVVSENGFLEIGENSKIGKGTIINCGGKIVIGVSVAVYGYCYFQSSIWHVENGERVYDHGSIMVADNAVISPFSVISHSAFVDKGVVIPPHSVVGNWIK